MASSLGDHSFERALNGFIDSNIGDKYLQDPENPSCRLRQSPSQPDSPRSDQSAKLSNILNNIRAALHDGSNLAKFVESDPRFKALSSRSPAGGNTPNPLEILEFAEAVIEFQRERVKLSDKGLKQYDAALTMTNDLHMDELKRAEKENRDMRVQMQNVVSDFDALSKRYQVDMAEFEALKAKSLETASELAKKEKLIEDLSRKLELLPKENEMLKMQRSDLEEEVKALKRELFPTARAWERTGRAPTHHVPDSMPYALAKSKEAAMPHLLCDVRKQETAAMGRCLMQVENDLTTFKRLSEEQRAEIQRLNNLLRAQNQANQAEGNPYYGSHKQLMNLRDVFVSMVKASNKIAETLKAKQEEPVEREDRSLHAAYMLKSNSEQREMYDKLLEVVKNMISVKSSTTSFYRCKADYCKLLELDELDLDLKYHKMLVEVEDSAVLVHQLEDDQIVHTEMIAHDALKAVRRDYKNLQFILKDEHYHVFRLDSADAYNRLYYALQYAGFLIDDSKLSIYSKVDITHLNTEETWPQDLVPVLFSKVVAYSEQAAQRSPTNAPNRPNVLVGAPYNAALGASLGSDGMLQPGAMTGAYAHTMELLVNNLFDNVNVLSEFTTSLMYYDQNSKSLVVYGPNLANKPKVLKPEDTFKFKATNNLEYSGAASPHAQGDDAFVEAYKVPFATFPNGEPVLDHFNPQLTNYSLVAVKYTPVANELGAAATDLGQLSLGAAHQPWAPLDANNFSYSQPAFAQPAEPSYEVEFELYYVLPLSPKYSEPLNRLMGKLPFMRLRMTSQAEALRDVVVEVDEEKFYAFVDGFLEMNIGPNLEEPIRIECASGYYRLVEGTTEITLMANLHTDKMESFSLNVTNPELFRQFVADLDKHGLKRLGSEAKTSTGQICIVTKGFIRIFATDERKADVLMAEFQPENTEVTVNDRMRSITITQRLDKVVNMDLDCLSPSVFAKWKFALRFAGFIDRDRAAPQADEMTTLKDFRFEIKIIDDAPEGERAVRVGPERIQLMTSPTAHNPLYVWDRASINLELYPGSRRLRIYIKKHTKNEERFDLIVPLLSDYQNITSMLEKMNYRVDEPSTKFGLRYHYVLSKPGVISLFRTKYDKDTLISIGAKSYEAIVRTETLTIRFKPRQQSKSPVKLTFKRESTFKKFLLALKIATFIPFSKEKMPMLFFPSIVYGFVCAEAKQLFKDCRI